MVTTGVAVLLIASGSAGAALLGSGRTLRDEAPNPLSITRAKPIDNGAVPLTRYFCGAGAGYPGIHFYQSAPSAPYAGSVRPSPPASPTKLSDCRLEGTIGYVRPPNNPGVDTIGFYFFPKSTGDNYYDIAATPAGAKRIASFLGTSAILIGYVRRPSGNTCPAPDSKPLWKFYTGNYNFYTTNRAEASGRSAKNGGVIACLFTSSTFGRLQKKF